MLPLLVVGGAYFAWCLVKEKKARRDARRIFEDAPNQPEEAEASEKNENQEE